MATAPPEGFPTEEQIEFARQTRISDLGADRIQELDYLCSVLLPSNDHWVVVFHGRTHWIYDGNPFSVDAVEGQYLVQSDGRSPAQGSNYIDLARSAGGPLSTEDLAEWRARPDGTCYSENLPDMYRGGD